MSEQRYDPVTGQWRTVGVPGPSAATVACPLCPDQNPLRDPARAGGDGRRGYRIVVMDSPEPILVDRPATPSVPDHSLYQARPAAGADEIVVYTDRHDASFADLTVAQVTRLVDVWADRYAVLGTRDDLSYVLVGEVGGGAAGHPYSTIHGYPDIPPLAARELAAARSHHHRHRTCAYCDVIAQERADGVRLVARNEYFLAFVPFAARAPHEVHVAAHRHATSLLDLTDVERGALAELLHTVAGGYQRLSGSPSPYVMAIHQAPTDDSGWLPFSHFHVEFTPTPPDPAHAWYSSYDALGGGAYVTAGVAEDMAAQLRRAVRAPAGLGQPVAGTAGV